MLAKPQDARSPEVEPTANSHPLDADVPDPTGMEPMCDRERFTAIVDGMVADEAPRVFAVVQEYGDRVDARIAAWGIAFDDHAEVIDVDGGMRMSLQGPENALRGFAWGSHITPRLVWVDPAAATPADDNEFQQQPDILRHVPNSAGAR